MANEVTKLPEPKRGKIVGVRCLQAVHVGAEVLSGMTDKQFAFDAQNTGIVVRRNGRAWLIPWSNISSCELTE